MSDSTTIYRGIDFGPDADLVDLVRKRLSGQLDHLSDPNDPTRHLWLEQAYEHLRAQGTGAPLANAFAGFLWVEIVDDTFHGYSMVGRTPITSTAHPRKNSASPDTLPMTTPTWRGPRSFR